MDVVSIKTPFYGHLSQDDFEHIYPPSEDTFLLIDAVEKDAAEILRMKPTLCLEIGVGSGLVITALASVLGRGCKYLGTDINPIACAKAKETAAKNGVDLETFCCDLASGICESAKGNVDLLLFNPPYVVTESDEVAAGDMELTWAGGTNGREVIDKLLPQLSSLLSPKGVFYIVLEKKNNPVHVQQIMNSFHFKGDCILQRKYPAESLSVMKFYRTL